MLSSALNNLSSDGMTCFCHILSYNLIDLPKSEAVKQQTCRNTNTKA